MSVQTLCQIREAAPADHQYQCRRCGAFVCTAHCDEETGRCTDCADRTGRNGNSG